MTLPATVCAAVVPVMKSIAVHTQAASDMMTGTAISAATVPRPKPRALIVPGVADELRGMRLKRVEAVAAVATQAVMSPRPQTTCPAT